MKASVLIALAGMIVSLVLGVVQVVCACVFGNGVPPCWARLTMHAFAIIPLVSLVVFFASLLKFNCEDSPWMGVKPSGNICVSCARITRREYWRRTWKWYAVSLLGLAMVVVPFLRCGSRDSLDLSREFQSWHWIIFSIGITLCLLSWVMTLSPLVGRFRDCNFSPWWVAVLWALAFIAPRMSIVPQSLMLFIAFCVDGTVGDNRYGRDPKGRRIVYDEDIAPNADEIK